MKRMKCATGRDLDKALADGEITQRDFDEVEDFKKFLIEKAATKEAPDDGNEPVL